MTRQKVLDLYSMDARCKLIELAAFLDAWTARKIRRFRLKAFRNAAKGTRKKQANRARQVLLAFSDPTTQPISQAPRRLLAVPGPKPSKIRTLNFQPSTNNALYRTSRTHGQSGHRRLSRYGDGWLPGGVRAAFWAGFDRSSVMAFTIISVN